MPYRLPRACRYFGCPNLTTNSNGYCNGHQQFRRGPDYRQNASKRGYNARWQRVRAQVLREEPLCRKCKAKGLVVPAKDVHHIDGDVNNLRRENLEPLCRKCHNLETRSKQRG